MKIGRTRRNWYALLGVFVAVGLFAFLVQRFDSSDEVDAANMAGFDAGYIISDYQMGNYGSMSEGDIQRFLKSKNPCNDTRTWLTGNNVGHLSESTPYSWHVSGGHYVCMADENFNGESAAHIIWQAAQDYRINPQVLIVLLQKEQGLVTDTLPNSVQYRSATGYGCPDTAACSSKYYGFKNQIRNAAALFRTVLDGGWTNYPVGNNYVRYNPNAACGGTIVNIRNRATSALYRYTPYQPNAAALSSSYGGGDGCSAYGNRNFYSYFEDWFGGIKNAGLTIPESSYVVEGEYTVKSALNDSAVVDVAGGSNNNGTNIQLYDNNGTDAQKWEVKSDDEGSYILTNTKTKKVLDVAAAGYANGTNVQLYQLNGSCAQEWRVVRNSDMTYSLYSSCSGMAMDVSGGKSNNGANVQIYWPNHTSAQRWVFAAPQEVRGGEYIITSKVSSGMVLDVAGGGDADGTNVQIYEANQTAAQRWQVIYGIDGYYTIVNPATGKVLDAADDGMKNGTNAQLYASNDTCTQRWQIVGNEDGGYSIYSACSGLALDVAGGGNSNGTNVQLYDFNGTKAQEWQFDAIQNVVEGDYVIESELGIDMVVDIAGGINANGTNVQIYKNNESDAQKWRLQSDGVGYYTIVNPATGKALDVVGGGVRNGSNVQLFTVNGTLAQKWQLVKNDDGSYVIYSARSGLVLDVAGGDGSNGANVQLYKSNNTKAQGWKLISL